MKKIILTSAIIFATVAASFAQTPIVPATPIGTSSDATVNLKLYPIQSIAVNPSQKNVDLVYNSVENYVNGVESEQKDHLTIFSVGGFAVTVTSAKDDMSGGNSNTPVSASTIHVEASAGSSNPIADASYNNISLSSTKGDNLISSTNSAINKSVNITYSGMGANAYADRFIDGEKSTVYTTTVTYAIVAQ